MRVVKLAVWSDLKLLDPNLSDFKLLRPTLGDFKLLAPNESDFKSDPTLRRF